MRLRDLFQDWRANAGDQRTQLLLVAFRFAAAARGDRDREPSAPAAVVGVFYRVFFTWLLGVEIPWKTRIGPRLRVYHGFGIVINDGSVLGADVVLRHGATVGHRTPGGPCPVIGDRVEIGPHAVILGGITIGEDARIAPNALVLDDVPPGAVVMGNPAQVVRTRSR